MPDYSDYYEHNQEAGFDFIDRLPGSEFLSADERAEAVDLFTAGYVTGEGTREDFLEFYGMTDQDFPWEDWREWMGYDGA